MSQPIDVSIEYLPECVDEGALVTPLGGDRYRLELHPAPPETIDRTGPRMKRYPRAGERRRLPSYGDIIEAREIGPGALRFVRVIERARFKRFNLFGSRGAASSRFAQILTAVEELGGHWECSFGSCWIIFLPEDCAYDLKEALRADDAPPPPVA